MTTKASFVFLLPLAGAFLSPVTFGADNFAIPPTFTGSWHWKFAMPDGTEVRPTIKLKQEGETVTGTSRIRSGTEMTITNGVVHGDTIAFDVVRRQHGETATTHYTGKREGNLIHGSVQSDWAGESKTYPWEARRQAGIESTWKWSVQFGTRKFSDSVTFKLEGEKLTGTMPGVGRGAKPAEIREASFKDGAVSFEVERGQGDFHSIAKFQAKLEGDTLKGTSELLLDNREPRTDDWEAKRAD